MGAMTGYRRGLWAETLSAWYLRAKGYRILAMRYKTRVGEIDIVARRGSVLVFAEVKWRGTQEAAGQVIHAANQARVRQAAELYLQNHPRYTGLGVRFDALLWAPARWPLHIMNAF